ncbi:MAG: ABC transporter ATP-binding protein [Pseudomonadota bacterium]
MTTPLITARGLRKRFGRQEVLHGLDFDIEEGQIVGLIGPNGAGKTTVLKAILGLQPCDGELSVLGLNPYTQRSQLMQEVCFIADVATLPGWLRVQDLLAMMPGLHPRFDASRALDFLERTEVRPKARIKELSKGMTVQLHLAIVMAIEARLLVLDEPTLGLDLLYRKAFYETLLTDYFDEKRTILVTTHQVEEIERILTHLMFIRSGELVLNSSMEDMADRYLEVLVHPDQVAQAQALQPVYERSMFGKKVFLFEGQPRDTLSSLGEVHSPSVADLFVAKMAPSSKVAA